MVYVFFADGFEEIEALTPVDVLRRAGIEVITVGIGKTEIKGAHGIKITADISDDDMIIDRNIQMIILPGGMPGTVNLEASKKVQDTISYCRKNEIYIAAICAAPSILGNLGALKDKDFTCYPGFEKACTGGFFINENVVVCENYITSKGAGTALDFSFTLVKLLLGEKISERLQSQMQC